MKQTIRLTESELKGLIIQMLEESIEDNSVFQNYEDHGDFHYGWAWVRGKHGFNYISNDGQLLFPNQWLKWAWDFGANGTARVLTTDGDGYDLEYRINTKGEPVDDFARNQLSIKSKKKTYPDSLVESITRAIRKLLH